MKTAQFEMTLYPICTICGKKLDGKLRDPAGLRPALLMCESGNHCISEDKFNKIKGREYISADGSLIFKPST